MDGWIHTTPIVDSQTQTGPLLLQFTTSFSLSLSLHLGSKDMPKDLSSSLTSFFFFFLSLSLPMYNSHLFRGVEGNCGNPQAGYHTGDAVLDLTRSPMLSPKSSSNLTGVASSPLHLQFGGLAHGNLTSLDVAAAGAEVDTGMFSFPRGSMENWGDSGMVVSSPRTDTSTDVETEDMNHMMGGGHHGAIVCLDSSAVSMEKIGDHKTLRRLAQNREAARKSRLRKKAYVQQLETSRLKLMQLEQELQRARQ